MNVYDEFRIKVIEILHGNDYETLCYIHNSSNSLDEQKALNLPITLERVLKAIKEEVKIFEILNGSKNYIQLNFGWLKFYILWKLVKEDGFTPCTHEDQSEDTIKALLEVLK